MTVQTRIIQVANPLDKATALRLQAALEATPTRFQQCLAQFAEAEGVRIPETVVPRFSVTPDGNIRIEFEEKL
jgi:hypothetical protein